jgi:hypothetical protein
VTLLRLGATPVLVRACFGPLCQHNHTPSFQTLHKAAKDWRAYLADESRAAIAQEVRHEAHERERARDWAVAAEDDARRQANLDAFDALPPEEQKARRADLFGRMRAANANGRTPLAAPDDPRAEHDHQQDADFARWQRGAERRQFGDDAHGPADDDHDDDDHDDDEDHAAGDQEDQPEPGP